jgi:hypothetical protein
MTNIKIEIETEDGTSTHGAKQPTQLMAGKVGLVSAGKVGLLSSINLSSDLFTAFTGALGVSNPSTQQGLGYKLADILAGRDILQNTNNCTTIATAGGLITCSALARAAGSVPFVSLVGTVPATLGKCQGGVSLESFKSNKERKAYLANLHCATIILLSNPNSAMHNAESTAWGAAGFVESYVGGGGTNAAANFAWDFLGDGGPHPPQIPATANTGIVVSDDPYFQANRASLIWYANQWLQADATRFIVYPSQIYGESVLYAGNNTYVTPRAAQSILFGPDLVQAYTLLGILANYLANNNNANVGFFPVGNTITVVS